jgi:hypothetical protein
MADEPNIVGTASISIDVQTLKQTADKSKAVIEDVAKSARASAKKASESATDAAKAPIANVIGRRRTQAEKDAEFDAKTRARIERETGWETNRVIKRQQIERNRIIRETGWAQARERKAQEKEVARAQRETEREDARQRRNIFLQERAQQVERQRDLSRLRGVSDRTLRAPAAVQAQIAGILNAPGAAVARSGMRGVGLSPMQAIITQLQAGGIAPPVAQFAAGAGGRRPPGWGGGRGVAGGGGMFGGSMGRRILGGAASALGIGVTGFGAYAAVQAGQAVVDATKTATAYERQKIAAEGLAGSQAKLNALLEAYSQASGGAVDKVTSLANVTRLLATGFAKTVPEAERFVRATRGASIALGRPQEEVTQETQLAISNTSVKRLDQIGLGIQEVNDRIEQLRATNSNWTREMAFQDAVLSVMEEKYGSLTETAEGQATEVELLAKAWNDLYLTMGQSAQGGVNETASWLSNLIGLLDAAIARSQQLRKDRESITGPNAWVMPGGFIAPWQNAGPGIDLGRFAASSVSRDRARHPRGRIGNVAITPPRFDEEEMEGLREFERSKTEMEEQHQAERLQATEQYEESRTSVIRNYEKQIAREAEDFAIRRARSARDYNKSVSDLIEDAAKRDTELTEDYTERVADFREDSEKRIAELQEEYQEQREKSEKDHQDRLLKAAGSLDAIAVLDERKRWKRENEEREDAHKEQLEEARDSLSEQLEDAREAYEERLADAREADAERLQDMQDARAQQLADEDADRALQLARAKEDHDDQLAELDRQHLLRMAQIEEQARKEREQWNTEFEDFLADHNIYVKGLTEKREKVDELTIEWLDKLTEELETRLANLEKADKETTPFNEYDPDSAGGPKLYAKGGRVGRTGPAILHAGEFVLSRGMLAGNQPVPAAIANSFANKNIVIESGAIALYPSPGMDAEGMLDSLEAQLIELLDKT